MSETRIEFDLNGLPEPARIWLAGLFTGLADPSAAVTALNGVVSVALDPARDLDQVRGLLSRSCAWLRTQGAAPVVRLRLGQQARSETT